jgi:NAD(P)-dependent dehydrogenase (short-subunit alcohol dehydrogenase family)
MSFDPRDKVILITGGAGGIGSALAESLAADGAQIIVADLDAKGADAVVADLPGVGHLSYALDVTDRVQVAALLSFVEERHGRIDVLVNNAAMTSADRFDERSVESIERELSINLVAPLVLSRLAIPLLRASKDPRICTTVSLGGIFPLGETPIYTASKFGLRGAMLAIGMDLGPKGITVGSVLPSATDTPMLRQEALDGGNSLQFLDPPQTPADVVKAFRRLLDRPRFEVYPKLSESWLVRIVMLWPSLIPKALPLFRGRGERGMAKYLADLERRGLITR